ncbi:12934_t:CDS:2, partial [Entrophospora sp. SA101]
MLSSENESTYNVGTSVDVKPNEEENVLEMESKYKNKVTEDRVNGLIKVWVCIHDKTFDEYNEELKILEGYMFEALFDKYKKPHSIVSNVRGPGAPLSGRFFG